MNRPPDVADAGQRRQEIRRSFLASGLAGAGFGLFAAVIFLRLGASGWSPPAVIVTAVLAAGLFSGGAGALSTHLYFAMEDRGVRRNIRTILSFVLVAIATLGVVATATRLGHITPDPMIRDYIAWGALAGLVFGAGIALWSYRAETVRQRMALLQMENRHLEDLARREELLREAARNLAVSEERTRMARELHDSIFQGIHGIAYSLHSLEALMQDDPRGAEILGHLEDSIAATSDDLRQLIDALAPSPLEERGLGEALRLHAELVARRSGIGLDLEIDYSGGLSPEAEMAVYRITQEALSNITRHADAQSLRLQLINRPEMVRLCIADDGRGFSPADTGRGYGLGNMVTRARHHDGTLHIETKPGEGCTITADFQRPCPGNQPHRPRCQDIPS